MAKIFAFKANIARKVSFFSTSFLIIPDTLSLSKSMQYFKNNRADFTLIMNEYALVVGIVTTHDLQCAVIETWSLHESEEQIVVRDGNP